MDQLNPITIGAFILAGAAAISTLAGAAGHIVSAIKAAKAPNQRQDDRLDALESKVQRIEGELALDNTRLDNLKDGNRVTQRALLALLDHGIDGNNIDQMQHAKEELQNHLINQ